MRELYALTFPNGKIYIGIAADSHRRLKAHLQNAKNGVTLNRF